MRAWSGTRTAQIGKRLKADSIRRECEASLRRLESDVIDLYQIHWPEPDEDIEEGWATLAELKSEGKVRWIGVSNFNVAQMKRAQAIAPITSLQPPYSLVHARDRGRDPAVRREHGIGVIAYSPMASGLLDRRHDAGARGGLAGRRLAEADTRISRSPCSRNLALVRAAPRDRAAARPHARRGGHRLDAAASGSHRRHRWNAFGQAGGRSHRGDGLPSRSARGGRDRDPSGREADACYFLSSASRMGFREARSSCPL